MKSEEKAVVFECAGVPLVGFLHRPERPRRQGVLVMVAGGPQYRVGCCRQLVLLGRSLAAKGTALMRFDYRGLGDSVAAPVGLERGEDLAAAIEVFLREVSEVEEVVLYGGCDGASAVAINGWSDPRITGWILNNPWVRTEDVQAKVMMKHYYWERLTQGEFWRKLLRLDFNVLQSLSSLLSTWKESRGGKATVDHSSPDPFNPARPFTERMLEGWRRFDGRVLLLLSGRSLISKEFDERVAGSADWQAVVRRESVERRVLEEADHTFSMPESRTALFDAIAHWLADWPQAGDDRPNQATKTSR